VVRRLRVDPELEHAARRVERAGDHALALELAHVADVDELHVVATVQFARLLDAEGGDVGHRLVDHRLYCLHRSLHRHAAIIHRGEPLGR